MAKDDKTPPAPTESPVETPKEGDGKFTPAELAKATGNVKTLTQEQAIRFGGGVPSLQTEQFTWQHNAAAQLHGWNAHEHHAGAPIRLSLKDYEAALKAATDTVTRAADEKGKPTGPGLDPEAVKKLNGTKPLVTAYEPHKPALSPHAPGAQKEPS